jgi:type II secretory pathway component GspD/PulD (secretin)
MLRTPGGDGGPRVRLVVKAGRKSVLSLDSPEAQATGNSVYANVSVTSEAVLDMNQTLILTGLSQRESTTSRSGIPGLMHVPIIKYLFSEKRTITSDLAIIILLTPRDPAFWDDQNQKATEEFVEKRRAYVQALQGTADDMRRFKERYPDWNKLAPNRFASHFFLMERSEVYRAANGVDLASDNLDFDLLGKPTRNKAK